MRIGRLAAVLVGLLLTVGAWAKKIEVTLPVPIDMPLPEYPAAILTEGTKTVVDSFVWTTEEGMVYRVVVTDSPGGEFEKPTVAALRRWTFKPAVVDGKNSGYIFIVPIEIDGHVIRTGEIRDEIKPDKPPRLIDGPHPEYPAALVIAGNRGKVMLHLLINRQGRVVDAEVIRADHPAFEAPAVAAVFKWRLAPATLDGRAVTTRAVQSVSFDLPGNRVVETFKMERRPMAKVPEQFRVDVPPKPIVTVFAVHPFEQAIAGKKGSAEVKVLVGPEGVVLFTEILSVSDPEFGLALAAALEAWEFVPATRSKEPVLSAINRKQDFLVGNRESAVDKETGVIARLIREDKFSTAQPQDLDSRLRPTFRVPPVYPTVLIEEGPEGTAKIEVIVDKKGRAVLPRIVEASEPEFGWAAATAAQRWLFEPPTVGGKPVEVKVVIPFKFSAPAPKAPGG